MYKTTHIINNPFNKSVERVVEDHFNRFRFHTFENLALWIEMIQSIQDNKLITAIKCCRAGTGLGLKEAKTFVEDLKVKELRFINNERDLLLENFPEYFI